MPAMRSGLRVAERGVEGFDAGKMRAVGAGARDEFGMAVDEECRVPVLHDGRERLDAIDQAALVGIRKPQQHRGDVAGGKRLGEGRDECRRLLDWRRHQIEARRGRGAACFSRLAMTPEC